MKDARSPIKITPTARFLRNTATSKALESRRTKHRVFDFVIRDEAVAKSYGEFTNQVLFDPVDEEWQPYVSSCFSTSFHIYRWFMFLVSAMLCFLKPIQWSGISQEDDLVQSLFDYPHMCSMLDWMFLAALLYRFRYSVIIKQWELFHPLYILQIQVFKFRFWCGIASTAAAFSMPSATFPAKCEQEFALVTSRMVLGYIEELKLFFVWHCFGAKTRGQGTELVRLVVAGLLLLHFFACWWFALGRLDCTLDTHMASATRLAWNDANARELETGNVKKISYWLLALREVTMMMLGDGRPAYSDSELLFSILVGLVGLVSCSSLLVAHVIQWLRHANLLADDQEEHLTVSRQALKSMDVPLHLVERIMSFQHFALQSYNHHYNAVLFDNISAPLALELRLVLYHDLLVNAPFLSEASANVVKKLVMNMKDTLYQPGDFVVRKNEPADEMYFIVRGECDVLPVLDRAVIRTFFAGDYFGEIAILQQTQGTRVSRRTAWVRAVAHTNLCTLRKEDFEETFELFPEEKAVLIERLRIILPEPKKNTRNLESRGAHVKPKYIRDAQGLYVAVLPGQAPPPMTEGTPTSRHDRQADTQEPTKRKSRNFQAISRRARSSRHTVGPAGRKGILEASRTLGNLYKAPSKVNNVLRMLRLKWSSSKATIENAPEVMAPRAADVFPIIEDQPLSTFNNVGPISRTSSVNDSGQPIPSREQSLSSTGSTIISGTAAPVHDRNTIMKMYSFDSSTLTKSRDSHPPKKSVAARATSRFWKSIRHKKSETDSARASVASCDFGDFGDYDDSLSSNCSIGHLDTREASDILPGSCDESSEFAGYTEESPAFLCQAALRHNDEENVLSDADKKEQKDALGHLDSSAAPVNMDVTPNGSSHGGSARSTLKSVKKSESIQSVKFVLRDDGNVRDSESDISSVQRFSTDTVATANLEEASQFLESLPSKPPPGIRVSARRDVNRDSSHTTMGRQTTAFSQEGMGGPSSNPESMAEVHDVIKEFVTAQQQSQQVLRSLQESVRTLAALMPSQ